MLKSRQNLRCAGCGNMYPPDEEVKHKNGIPHFLGVITNALNSKEEELMKDKEGIRTVCRETRESGNIVTINCEPNVRSRVTLEIHSDLFDVELQTFILLESTELLTVSREDERSGHSAKIKKHDSFNLVLSGGGEQCSGKTIPLAMKFKRPGQSQIVIVRYISVQISDSAVKFLEPKQPYKEAARVPRLPDATKIIKLSKAEAPSGRSRRCAPTTSDEHDPENLSDMPLTNDAARREVKLAMYPLSQEIKNFHLSNFAATEEMSDEEKEELSRTNATLESGLPRCKKDAKNYSKFFRLLLNCEDIQQATDIRMYDQSEAKLMVKDFKNMQFTLEVEGLEEGRPSVLRYDSIYVRVTDEETEYQGFIERTHDRTITLVLPQKFTRASCWDDEEEMALKESATFGVRFEVNRKVVRLMHRALDTYEKLVDTAEDIYRFLVPDFQLPPKPTLAQLPKLDLVNKKIASNREQFCAVKHILLGTHRPLPYVLFGPPGTGKTTTITEAIVQVYSRLENSHILITTPSNAAANVVAEKLLATGRIEEGDLFRMYGASANGKKVSEILKPHSNYNSILDSYEEVEANDLMKKRIVISTISSSGTIISNGVPRGHFSHVFIDEAGHAMEPEAIIPIMGLVNFVPPNYGSVILSGDPLQLGPVIRSPKARAHLLVKSLLERLMDTAPYLRHENQHYDPRYITKLVQNFRSHPSLLEVPNKLFYAKELEAKGDCETTQALVMYEKLPSPVTPIIFHGVNGQELREFSNPSFFNPQECAVVFEYVQHLLCSETFSGTPIQEEDIGIISPYRKQVLKIRELLKRAGIEKTTVGSTEEFQGQERMVIIISTVRSSKVVFRSKLGESLGFLKNRKRFNVATTRAKSLMIVVGDPEVLGEDYCWRTFLNFCREKECCTGVRYMSPTKRYDDLFQKLETLHIELKGAKLAANGRIAITDLTAQEEPRYRDDD